MFVFHEKLRIWNFSPDSLINNMQSAVMKLISTEVTWKCDNMGTANVLDLYEQRQGSLSSLSVSALPWLADLSVRRWGLKDGGLIKADYEGESVLASHSDHHSDGFIMEALLHPPPLSPRPPSAVVHLPRRTTCWQVGERQTNRDRDDVLPWCCWCRLFNLWLLTCSAQRLPMHFYCVVHQDLCFIGCVCHFFKAALSDFYWVIWGQRNKLKTQHLTYYNTLWQTVAYFHMQQTQINIIIPLKSCLCLPDDSPSSIHSPS